MSKKDKRKINAPSIDWRFTNVGNGKVSLDITCTKCGKPITKSTKYGMFCANGCGEKEATETGKEFEKLLNTLLDLAGDDCWGKP